MSTVTVDFSKNVGKVKPMHAVNNGPIYKLHAAEQKLGNMNDYKAAGIPYARTHDASFCATYGGEHTVDVHLIFSNFDSDPYDEKSYDFHYTDEYLQTILQSGAKVFYRLGTKIEHGSKRYGTIPPNDFNKWAVICEHIVRHYNEGWANGFNMNIEYWEIWNEPDGAPNWTGTPKQYYDLYNITSKHLKKCYPNIKIGGPALAFIDGKEWLTNFINQIELQPDFFSWHIYTTDPHYFKQTIDYARKLFDDKGWTDTELIINEWNYVIEFVDEDKWLYSLKAMVSLKGAAFISAVMSVCQYSDLDMLMYYDARPCGMNGLFDTYFDKLKGYYSIYMFNDMYKLGESVKVSSDDDTIYICAAKNDDRCIVVITRFDDDDNAQEKEVKVNISGLDRTQKYRFSYFNLDNEYDLKCLREETISSSDCSVYLTIGNYSSVEIKIERL